MMSMALLTRRSFQQSKPAVAPYQRTNSFWSSWPNEKPVGQNPPHSPGVISSSCLEELYKVREQPAASGAFGEVYAGKCRATGEDVAIKAMRKKVNPNALREVELLARVDHPTVAKFLGYFEDDDHLYVVTPFYSGGDLFEHIIEKEDSLFDEFGAMCICVNLLESVQAIHQAGIGASLLPTGCAVCDASLLLQHILMSSLRILSSVSVPSQRAYCSDELCVCS